MKKQPKSTRNEIPIGEVNKELSKLLGTVGSSVEFIYKGHKKVKGILLRPVEEGILLKMQSDYIGDVCWEVGEKKYFENRTVYNYNIKQ